MTALEATLLRWTRETVWYEPRALEALGGAAVCNSLARLALVRQ